MVYPLKGCFEMILNLRNDLEGNLVALDSAKEACCKCS